MNQKKHQLLIQKLLVSIHYLTLFRDEIVLVVKMPSLLGASFSPNVVQSELGEILSAIDALSKQEKLIKSTFWYDESSFKVMNRSLDMVGSWVRGIDNILELCESKSVFQAILGDERAHVFGILIDVFTSLRITNLSIIEESDYPILMDPYKVVKLQGQARRLTKKELLAKIDAMVPHDSESASEELKESHKFQNSHKEDVVKLFRHYLFDNSASLVFVIDAQDDLSNEIAFYNAFNRFEGVFGETSNNIILLERVLDLLKERSLENLDLQEEQEVVASLLKPVYLIVYGQNQLMSDSRFESLFEDLQKYSGRVDFTILSYQAYD